MRGVEESRHLQLRGVDERVLLPMLMQKLAMRRGGVGFCLSARVKGGALEARHRVVVVVGVDGGVGARGLEPATSAR
jgi:hypothetical protein